MSSDEFVMNNSEYYPTPNGDKMPMNTKDDDGNNVQNNSNDTRNNMNNDHDNDHDIEHYDITNTQSLAPFNSQSSSQLSQASVTNLNNINDTNNTNNNDIYAKSMLSFFDTRIHKL